jgi:hypothetical protein
MTSAGRIAAVALGVFLGAVPFLRYRLATPHPTAHADHAPRHGGILGMVGDHHLEVVRRDGSVEVYVTDAYRRPIAASGGRVEFDTGRTEPLARTGGRLVARDDPAATELTCTVVLDADEVARMTVAF